MKIDKELRQIKSDLSKNTEFKLKHIIKISLVIGFFLILTLMGLSYMLFHDTSHPQEFSMPTTVWEPPKCNISSECESHEICKENVCTTLQCGVNQITINHNCYDKKFITSEDITINDSTIIAMNMTFELAEKENVLVGIYASRNGGFFFCHIDVNKEPVIKGDMEGGIKTIDKSFLNKGENSMTIRFKSGNSPFFWGLPFNNK